MKKIAALLLVALTVVGPTFAQDKTKKRVPTTANSKVLVGPSTVPMGASSTMISISSAPSGGSKVLQGPSSAPVGASSVGSPPTATAPSTGPSSTLNSASSTFNGDSKVFATASSAGVTPSKVFVTPREAVPIREQDPVNFQTPEQARRTQRRYQRNYYSNPLVQAPALPSVATSVDNQHPNYINSKDFDWELLYNPQTMYSRKAREYRQRHPFLRPPGTDGAQLGRLVSDI